MQNARQDEAQMVLGLGCERGAPGAEVLALARTALEHAGIVSSSIRAIATLENRRGEAAIEAVAAYFAVPLHVFSAARLEMETPRLQNPSDLVFAYTGCHGVAEAAALAAAGTQGVLVLGKIKSAHATVAVARAGCRFENGSVQ